MKWELIGSVWIDLSGEEESGDALSRDVSHERGESVRHLGSWTIATRYATHNIPMALVKVVFNSGEEGEARVKIGTTGFVDVYKRVLLADAKT